MSRAALVRVVSMMLAAAGASGSALAQVTNTQIPLNYNFHGMVHNSGEVAAPDLDAGYRSIAVHGQIFFAGYAGGETESLYDYVYGAAGHVLTTKTGISYGFFDTLGYGNTIYSGPLTAADQGLDIVHLGARCGSPADPAALISAYDANAGTTTVGDTPDWSVCDQTTAQTTTLSSPVVIDATTEIGLLYNSSATSGQFSVVLGFSDHASMTVSIGATKTDAYNTTDPAIVASQPVKVQTKLSHSGGVLPTAFRGLAGIDAATIQTGSVGSSANNVNIVEGIISVPMIVNGIGGVIATPDIGAHLTSITFQKNASSFATAHGYAIYAVTVRTGSDNANSTCATAQAVAGGATASNLLRPSTTSPATSCGGGNDTRAVWFAYTATGSANTINNMEPVIASVAGTTNGIATANATLAVYDACGGNVLGCTAGGASITWLGTAGQTYYLRVGSINNNPNIDGAFTLNISEPLPPPNMTCDRAQAVSTGDTAVSTLNGFAADTTTCGGGLDTRALWFVYTAATSGPVQANTCTPGTMDTVITVYEDTCTASQIGCNDNGCGIGSIVRWTATAGHNYYIRIADIRGTVGVSTLHIDDPAPTQHTDTPLPLHYNWNGFISGDSERTNPTTGTAALIGSINENRCNLNGFRSVGGNAAGDYSSILVSDPNFYAPDAVPAAKGKCFDSFGPLGYQGILYAPSHNVLVPDCVYIGDRSRLLDPTGAATGLKFNPNDGTVLWPNNCGGTNGTATSVRGYFPAWLTQYDQTGPQVSDVTSAHVAFGPSTILGLIYYGTNVYTSSPQRFPSIDVKLTFTDGTFVTVTIYAPSPVVGDSGTNGTIPTAAADSGLVTEQPLINFGTTLGYYGAFHVDQAALTGTNRVRLYEAVISTASLQAKAVPFDPTGKQLASITFLNPVNYASGTDATPRTASSAFAVFAATIRDALATGACCASDGSCVVATPGFPAATCATGNLVAGGTCSPNACPPPSGVCCRGATCNASVTQASCTVTAAAAGANYSTAGSTCNVPGGYTTPCCYSDYNKVNGKNVADIFAFLSDWFGHKAYAVVEGDGSSGTPIVADIFKFLSAWFAGGC